SKDQEPRRCQLDWILSQIPRDNQFPASQSFWWLLQGNEVTGKDGYLQAEEKSPASLLPASETMTMQSALVLRAVMLSLSWFHTARDTLETSTTLEKEAQTVLFPADHKIG
ncbi:hypothetical protein STEG23_001222, partial [Scotinomys teguina]